MVKTKDKYIVIGKRITVLIACISCMAVIIIFLIVYIILQGKQIKGQREHIDQLTSYLSEKQKSSSQSQDKDSKKFDKRSDALC